MTTQIPGQSSLENLKQPAAGPLSVTIISWLFIAAGTVGFVCHAREFNFRHPFHDDVAWVFFHRRRGAAILPRYGPGTHPAEAAWSPNWRGEVAKIWQDLWGAAVVVCARCFSPVAGNLTRRRGCQPHPRNLNPQLLSPPGVCRTRSLQLLPR